MSHTALEWISMRKPFQMWAWCCALLLPSNPLGLWAILGWWLKIREFPNNNKGCMPGVTKAPQQPRSTNTSSRHHLGPLWRSQLKVIAHTIDRCVEGAGYILYISDSGKSAHCSRGQQAHWRCRLATAYLEQANLAILLKPKLTFPVYVCSLTKMYVKCVYVCICAHGSHSALLSHSLHHFRRLMSPQITHLERGREWRVYKHMWKEDFN